MIVYFGREFYWNRYTSLLNLLEALSRCGSVFRRYQRQEKLVKTSFLSSSAKQPPSGSRVPASEPCLEERGRH